MIKYNFIYSLIFISFILTESQENFKILDNDISRLQLIFDLTDYKIKEEGDFSHIQTNSKGETSVLGMPKLPKFSTMLMVEPDREYNISYTVLESEFIENINIIPNQDIVKGLESKEIKNIDLEFYSSRDSYPYENITLSEPMIMRDLVLSPPDQYSPLNGHDLIALKVNLIVWMDGMYNFGCAEHDTFDWLGSDTGCHGSAKLAVENWPSTVKQIFSPVGADVLHGAWLNGCAGKDDPSRRAFQDWGVGRTGRSSWDPIAVMIAVRGTDAIN